MADCISETAGTIGYIDAGHGQAAGLSEVAIPVGGDHQVSSTDLINRAISVDALPAADASFDGVSFVTDGSNGGWPLVLMSYVYVRKNVSSYITDPTEQALLVAFLNSLFDPLYITKCKEKYGFLLPQVESYVRPVLNELAATVSGDLFVFEDDPAVVPTTPLAISTHRQEIADIEREALLNGVSGNSDFAVAELAALRVELANVLAKNEELEQALERSGIAVGNGVNSGNVTTALAFISFILWLLAGAMFVFRYMKADKRETVTSNYGGDLELKNNNNGVGVQDMTI